MKPNSPLFRLVAKFLFAALVPQAIAPALAANIVKPVGGDDGWTEVCTVFGTKWINQAYITHGTNESEKSSKSHDASAGHCIFCASTEALAVIDVARLVDESDSLATQTYANTPAARVFSGHSILSRAPPVLS